MFEREHTSALMRAAGQTCSCKIACTIRCFLLKSAGFWLLLIARVNIFLPRMYLHLIADTLSCKQLYQQVATEPFPPANLSRISPPEPVAAPLKGSTVVENYVLCFQRKHGIKLFYLKKSATSLALRRKLLNRGPFYKRHVIFVCRYDIVGIGLRCFLMGWKACAASLHHR